MNSEKSLDASSLHSVNLDAVSMHSRFKDEPQQPQEEEEGFPFITLVSNKAKQRKQAQEQAAAEAEAQAAEQAMQRTYRVEPVELWSDDDALSPPAHHQPTATDALLMIDDPPIHDHLELVEHHKAMEKQKQRKLQIKKATIVFFGFLVCVGIFITIYTLFVGWDSANSSDKNNNTPPPPGTVAPGFPIPTGLPNETIQAILSDSTSPQSRAYDWLSRDPQRDLYPQWKIIQRFAVATMVYAVTTSMRNPPDIWLTYSTSECDWGELQSVTCDSDGRVQHLDLNRLSSTSPKGKKGSNNNDNDHDASTMFPAEVALLDRLESLNVMEHQLAGTMPDFASVRDLRSLDLSFNRLSKSIPAAIASLEMLQVLNLNSNRLTGKIPQQVWSMKSLVTLNLEETSITGMIPSLVGGLSNSLEKLVLSETQVTGSLPTQIGTLRQLQHLDLASNTIGGPLPSHIGGLSNLKLMSLSLSTVTGTIPTSVGGLRSAEQIDLSNTMLDGELPSELGSLTNLKWLDLSNNGHNGRIPAELQLEQLIYLDLSGNFLAGQYDLFFLNRLEHLDLGGNFLSGAMPLDLMVDMTSLKVLRLNGNTLSGTLQTEVGLFTNLIELDLSNLALFGGLPSELGLLTKLEVLKLSDTFLTGSFPDEGKNLQSLRHVELHYTELTGGLPAGFCAQSMSVNCDNVQCGSCDCDCWQQ